MPAALPHRSRTLHPVEEGAPACPACMGFSGRRQLAFEAAVQGQVLLSNVATNTPWGKAPLLPLQGAALKGKVVAVIGPNANATQVSCRGVHFVRGWAGTVVWLLTLWGVRVHRLCPGSVVKLLWNEHARCAKLPAFFAFLPSLLPVRARLWSCAPVAHVSLFSVPLRL
jgi:hypothetical protein